MKLAWPPATDDATAPSNIIYNVYASTTLGGQTFANPILTTAPGATSVVVTSADFASLAAGTEIFFVVRAQDQSGNTDVNTVELSVIPTANTFYVEAGTAGTGTLASPFGTVQEGIDAAEAAGSGTVLVAAGSYNEKVDINDNSAVSVNLFGGFPSWSTLAGADDAAVLASRNPLAQVATISGIGLGFGFPEGLIEVQNSGVPTFIDGFTVTESGDASLLGTDVDLQVSCAYFTNAPGGNTANDALRIESSVPTFDNQLTVAGVTIDEHSDGIEIGGATRRFRVYSSTFADLGSNGITDSNPLVVPSGQTLEVTFQNNTMFELSDAIELDFEPEQNAVAGSLSVNFIGNDIRNVSSTAIELEDVLFFGRGGTASILFRDNYIFGVSSDHVDIDLMSSDDDSVPDGAFSVDFINNFFLSGNDNVIEIDAFAAAAGLTGTINIDRCTLGQVEGNLLDIDDEFNATAGVYDGGTLNVTISNSTFINGDDVMNLDVGCPPSGQVNIDLFSNDLGINYGTLFELDVDGYTGVPAAGTATGHHRVRVFNNTGASGDDDIAEIDVGLSDGTGLFAMWNNDFQNSYNEIDYDDSSGDNGSLDVFIQNNSLQGNFEEACFDFETDVNTLALLARNEMGLNDVDSEAALEVGHSGDQSSYIMIRNNVFALAAGDGLEVDDEPMVAQIVNNTIAQNSQSNNSSDYGVEAAGSGISQFYVANSIVTNNPQDLDDNPVLRAFFSLIGDQGAAAGFGSISGLANFLMGADIRDFDTYFRLGAGSPAINAGNPDPFYQDPDGSRNDMGAFGGPQSGQIGHLGPNATVPLVGLGIRPFPYLFTGRRQAPAGGPFIAVFSDDIAAASVSPTSLAFSVGGTPLSGTYSTTHNRVQFTPSAPVPAGSLVTVTANGLTTTSGGALEAPWNERFVVEAASVAEVEGNDSTGTAQTLGTFVFRIAGAVNPGGGDTDDFYRITAQAGQRLTLSAFSERDFGSGGDVRLTLLDSDGTTVLNQNEDLFGVIGSGNRVDPFLEHTFATSGTFFVQLDEETGAGGPYTYDLVGWLR